MLNHNNIKLARYKAMEQLTAIKKILKIHTFQDVRVSYIGFIGSTELITFSCLIALICSVILRNINPNYIIIGTIVPLYLSYKGVKIDNYWECFALFLLIRRFTIVLAFLDIFLLICLWHPNIALGKWLVSKVKERFRKC